MSLEDLYQSRCGIASDINEHLPTLCEYAKDCSSVAEFGVRGGESTIALLCGLSKSQSTDKRYIGVDINWCDITTSMSEHSKNNGIDYKFIQADSAKVNLPKVDLLFIDSWHVYAHLKRELDNNHDKVSKYIIMHDTTIFEHLSESICFGWDVRKQSIETGYPEDEIRIGLWPAVEKFLNENKDAWRLKQRFTNNNGLTILERI